MEIHSFACLVKNEALKHFCLSTYQLTAYCINMWKLRLLLLLQGVAVLSNSQPAFRSLRLIVIVFRNFILNIVVYFAKELSRNLRQYFFYKGEDIVIHVLHKLACILHFSTRHCHVINPLCFGVCWRQLKLSALFSLICQAEAPCAFKYPSSNLAFADISLHALRYTCLGSGFSV